MKQCQCSLTYMLINVSEPVCPTHLKLFKIIMKDKEINLWPRKEIISHCNMLTLDMSICIKQGLRLSTHFTYCFSYCLLSLTIVFKLRLERRRANVKTLNNHDCYSSVICFWCYSEIFFNLEQLIVLVSQIWYI